MRSFVRLLLVFALAWGSMMPVGAAAPYGWVRPDGRPFAWNNSQPIPYSVDQGPLGQLTNPEAVALVQSAFQIWDETDSALISFIPGPPLPQDITGANVMPFLNNLAPGTIPIILDTDGSVIKTLLGDPTAAVALGRPTSNDPASGTITGGFVVLNGLPIDGRFNPDDLTLVDYRGMGVQEIGHVLGLGNSQLNTELILDGIPENNNLIPQMYPQPVAGNGDQLTADDRASISTLYPNPGLAGTIGTIKGQVLLPDGVTGVQGYNVVARRAGDPTVTAVSAITGMRYKNEIGPPGADGSRQIALRGAFEITGLPPGSYTLTLEALRPDSMAGPLRHPAFLPGGTQYYRAGGPATNDPNAATQIPIGPGQVVENVNLIINAPAGPALQNLNEQEPNEFPEQAQALPLVARVQGSVQPGDLTGVTIPLSGGGSAPVQDLYRLTLTQPTLVTATLAAANPASDLNLYLLSGPVATAPKVQAASVDPGTPPESVQLRVPAGVYFLAVSLASGPGTTYTLDLNGTAAPDLPTPAPQKPKLNNLFVVNVTPTTASTAFLSDLPANTILYASNPLMEFSNPTLNTDHRQGLTNLAPGTAYRLRTLAVTQDLGVGILPDVFFTTALPALPGGVGPKIFAGTTDIIDDPDDPNAAFVVFSFRNVGTGDANDVTITSLTAPNGWAFSTPISTPLHLGFLGRGASGVILTRLVKTGPTDNAPILSGTGVYTSQGVGQQPFTFGGAVAFLTIQKSVAPSSARPGDIVTFTLSAINGGQGPATGVLLSDTLPAGLTFVDATNGGQFQNGAVIWNLGSLAANGSATVSFRAQLAPGAANGTPITNVALARSNENPTPIASNVVPLSVTAPPPQLQITKQANRATAGPGEVITYTLNYANVGGAPATNVVITDSLPGGTVLVDASDVYSVSGGVVSWAIGSLGLNGSGSRTLRVQVSPGTPGGTIVQNTAQIAAAEAPAAISSNTVQVSVTAPPQLQVTKSANVNSARPGDILTYSLTVANAGSGPATNVRLFDQVPDNTTYVDSQGGALQSGQVVWNLGTLAPGGSQLVSFRVQVQASAADAAVINNIALVTSTEIPNGVASNNVAVGIVATPQLQLAKSVNATQAQPGDILTYSLTASNTGAGPASNVQIFDQVPFGTSYVDSQGGALQSGQVVWNLGTVGPGGVQTVSFRVQVQGGASTINNVARVRSTEIPNGVASNNVTVGIATPPQLQLTKQADRQTAAPNDVISYSLNFRNNGPGQATNVQLTEAIPAGTQFVQAPGAGFSGNNLVWNLGTLPAGATGTRTMQVRVLSGTPSGTPIVNTASIDSQEAPAVNSNPVTVTVTVPTTPQLQIQKSVDRNQASPNDVLTYTISFFNSGNGTATNVSVQDQIPTNTTLVSASPGGVPFGGTVFWSFSALQPNQQASVTLTVRVNAGTPSNTQIANSARISSAELPNGVISNIATTTVIVATPPPALQIQKAADVSSAQPGGLINYTLTVTNVGGTTATNVIVTDNIPAGTTGVIAFDNGFISFGVAQWNVGTLVPGDQRQVHLRVQVNNNATGSVTNSGQARSNETPTPVVSNNVVVSISAPLNVSVQKTVDQSTAAPGATLRYVIAFHNSGQGTVNGATIQDQIPAGTQFVLASQQITPVGGVLTWNLPSIAPNTDGSVAFQARILQGTPDGTQITNQATFAVAAQGYSVNTNPVTTTVQAPAVLLNLFKQVDKQSAPANDILTYTLSYANQGSQTFTQLQIVDPLPPNTTFVDANNGQLNAGSVRFNLPVVGPGGTGNVSFRVRINQGVQAGTVISNQGRIGGPEVPQAVNSNTINTTVAAQQINLTFNKQVDKQTAPAGDLLTYTLSYVNNGPQTFTQLQIVDPLPANTTFFDANNNGQLNAGSVQWQLPQVGPGGSGNVSFRVRINQGVQAGTVISNQGRIGGPEVPQAINSNTVNTTVSPQQIALALTKQVDKQSAPAGDLLTYTLSYANNGGQTFNQLQIVDPIPANTTFDSANNGGQQVAGSVRFNLPQVGPGGSGSVSFKVRINQGVPAGTVIPNQAQIGGPEVAQPVASNTVNTTVAPPSQAPLTLSKQVNKQTAAPGEVLTYTISYTNNSGQTFSQLRLSDVLPAWTAFESADNGGQQVQGGVQWDLPPVGPGGSGSVTFKVDVNPVAPPATVIMNQARLSGAELAQAITSNTVNTTVGQPQPVNLTLTKQVDKTSAAAGDVLTYTITYNNGGQQTFTQLQIVDPLPPNTTFLDANNNGQLDAGSVRWQLPFVGPGGNGSVSFHVQINQGANSTTISNQAQIGGPEVPQATPSNTVNTAVGGGPPQTSFAGTWFAVPPTDHAVSLTVDSQNRFTVWAVSKDRTTVARSAQGHVNADGCFAASSADNLVQFTGQIAPPDGQSAMISAQRTGFVAFSVTAPRAPDVGPLPDNLVGTWNGFALAANGDRLQVRLSIDPGGNSTFQDDLLRAGSATTRLQFAHFYITPDGRVTDPSNNQQVGTLQLQGSQLVLNYNFQSTNPTPYQNNFQVQLQPLP